LDKVVFLADKIAWDQAGTPPYINQVTKALDKSLESAALAYINYLWEHRTQLRVVHPWLIEARQDLMSNF
jgi:HD superfamily phosphohydrolase YqeK